MIHTRRTVTIGDVESTIDKDIVLYRGDREVEVEFVLLGNKFEFTNAGNVIKSTNASRGQLVIDTPQRVKLFSEVTPCKEGSVIFVITAEMIDELEEVGLYSFQIRLFDEEQFSRISIPPVNDGIEIRSPLAAEDENTSSDTAVVDKAVVQNRNEEVGPTFDDAGDYNKTRWVKGDVISSGRLNKLEDAIYTIDNNMDALEDKVADDARTFEQKMVHLFENNNCMCVDLIPGTAEENTENIRAVLSMAKDKQVSEIRFPKNETYEVLAFCSSNGAEALPTFTIPSNVIVDLNGCTLKIKPNAYPRYHMFLFDHDTENSILRNGTLMGDRYEHEYKNISGSTTHEWGTGVFLTGTNNIAENLEITQFTGDGCYFGGYGNMNWGLRLFNTDFTRRYIDNEGVIHESTTAILSKDILFEDYKIGNGFNTLVYPYYGEDIPIVMDYTLRIHFYQNGTYLQSYYHLNHSEIIVPDDATSMRVELQNANDDFTDVIFIYSSKVGRDNTIQNCHIWDCRRQGISTSRNQNGKILNNIIHDINGTLPKSGIDIEDSRFTLNSLLVEGNDIFNCNGGALICYDGYNITIRNNRLNGNRTGGAISTQYSRNIVVENNILYGEVRIGGYDEDLEYGGNSFTNNTVKSFSKYVNFHNVKASGNLFENSNVVAYDSHFVKNIFVMKDMYPLDSNTRFIVNGADDCVFEDCTYIDQRTIRHNDARFTGDFKRCKFVAPTAQLYVRSYCIGCDINITNSYTIYLEGDNSLFLNNIV